MASGANPGIQRMLALDTDTYPFRSHVAANVDPECQPPATWQWMPIPSPDHTAADFKAYHKEEEQDIILVIQQHLQGRAEALHNRHLRSLDTILRGCLTETPTVEKLQHLLEHIHRSLLAKNTQERARAVQTSAALLQFATSLPGFDTSSTFSKAGEFVLQLGLCAYHPASDISRHAKGGINWLHKLLLQKRGLKTRKAADLWCQDGLHDPKCLGYRNLARVGEVFGEIFTEDQKRSFLQAGLLAIHHPHNRISHAGLVLMYSIVGEAGQLLEDEGEITNKIMGQLFNIRLMGKLPDALKELCSVGQD
ncbi:uncharacterized protein LOC123345883 [Mauremys mutica]|uniref:uncharacterized protein LOC123345883 n=1 Tax=Mauremys mutica TaxID=74926 RepID=UPI001D164AB6|nr:uncharacterized protein LOC123345883 [Mauremys mutica]